MNQMWCTDTRQRQTHIGELAAEQKFAMSLGPGKCSSNAVHQNVCMTDGNGKCHQNVLHCITCFFYMIINMSFNVWRGTRPLCQCIFQI